MKAKEALQTVIDRQNVFASFNKEPKITIATLTKTDADKIYNSLAGAMSPENLHCDGEITPAQARAKARIYMAAVRELQRMGFEIPEDCYEIR